RNRSHWSTSKTPSYTKSVSWQHHRELLMNGYLNCEDLIDPVVTFANSPESYMQYVDQHPEQSIKMGVTF
ncbi:hypothetical protein P4I50_17365, partial [Escherichia coli]